MEEQQATQMKRCPNCGALLKYDLGSDSYKCTHCDFGNQNALEAKIYKCRNCGATETVTGKGFSNKCSFCGSPDIVLQSGGDGINPDLILPFALNRAKAEELFKSWLVKNHVAPKMFKPDDITQLYIPAWLFSAETKSNYSASFGRNVKYTYWADNKSYTGTRVEYSTESGQYYQSYKDILVTAGDTVDEKNFAKLKPFELMSVKPFKPEYISGINTEYYSQDINDGIKSFSEYVKKDLEKKIKERHNAEFISKLDLVTSFEEKKGSYVLLPVYVAEHEFKGKKWDFFINGISGKIVGKSPKSLWKILALLGGIGVILGVGVYFLYKIST